MINLSDINGLNQFQSPSVPMNQCLAYAKNSADMIRPMALMIIILLIVSGIFIYLYLREKYGASRP